MQIRKMKEIRFFKRLSLDDIHVISGRRISQPQLSRIERGVAIPSEEEKTLIAKALKEPVLMVFPPEES